MVTELGLDEVVLQQLYKNKGGDGWLWYLKASDSHSFNLVLHLNQKRPVPRWLLPLPEKPKAVGLGPGSCCVGESISGNRGMWWKVLSVIKNHFHHCFWCRPCFKADNKKMNEEELIINSCTIYISLLNKAALLWFVLVSPWPPVVALLRLEGYRSWEAGKQEVKGVRIF